MYKTSALLLLFGDFVPEIQFLRAHESSGIADNNVYSLKGMSV